MLGIIGQLHLNSIKIYWAASQDVVERSSNWHLSLESNWRHSNLCTSALSSIESREKKVIVFSHKFRFVKLQHTSHCKLAQQTESALKIGKTAAWVEKYSFLYLTCIADYTIASLSSILNTHISWCRSLNLSSCFRLQSAEFWYSEDDRCAGESLQVRLFCWEHSFYQTYLH